MEALNQATIATVYGEKSISVFHCDILDFDREIDILTTSAFYRAYSPTPRTLFAALSTAGIQVMELAMEPEMDLRKLCNVWLSKEITDSSLPIRRIGCVEMTPYTRERNAASSVENKMFHSIQAYFQMLDIAAKFGVKMDTVALPLLGAGSQQIAKELTMIPLLNECVEFLKRNESVKRIYLIERNPAIAFKMAMALEQSYAIFKEKNSVVHKKEVSVKSDSLAFISYSSKDKNIADNLCAKLEANGIKAWYAPRDISVSDYATDIVRAIARCTHFIVIISENSLASQHVLNEIDLAFKELNRNINFLPLKIDDGDMAPAFTYYLSRQHWMDARIPPIEKRIEEFVEKIKRSE